MHFGAPSTPIKGWVISLQNLQSNSVFFSIEQKNKEVNKHFKIPRQFQH